MKHIPRPNRIKVWSFRMNTPVSTVTEAVRDYDTRLTELSGSTPQVMYWDGAVGWEEGVWA